MPRTRVGCVVAVWLVFAGIVAAEDPPTLLTARGLVDRVEVGILTIQPRGPDGRLEKSIELKLTGTSKLCTLRTQNRGGKKVLVQRGSDWQDLRPRQPVVVIYASGQSGPVLLSAVTQPAEDK
jgi:hypothetical protein